MTERLPSLNALRAFEAAARHGHFGKAGDELRVTHGAISRQVRALEDDLGVTLFERRNRGVFLTTAGRRLLDATTAAFRQVAITSAELRAARPEPLVISCEPTLTLRWLIPRLPRFYAEHPDIAIELRAAGGPIELEGTGVDCAIRRSDFVWAPDVHAETLFEERVGPVCAPSAATMDVDALLSRPRIHTATRPDAWDRWALDAGVELPVAPHLTFEHFYLSLETATAGIGVAIGPEPLIIDALASGRLIAPFDLRPNGFRYVLLSRDAIGRDARKVAVLDWLRRVLKPS